MSVSLGLVRPASPVRSYIARQVHRRLNALLAPAGIRLNGPNPWDPQIHRTAAIVRIFFNGTLGAGESYVDGDWDCARLDALTARLLESDVYKSFAWRSPVAVVNDALARLTNGQTRTRVKTGVTSHYDIGDDLYTAMLGPTMAYSCAYWARANTLDMAQTAKYDLACRKLHLGPGQRVLDVGCGWGGFAAHAAKCYGVHVTGITVSPTQAAFARRRCADLPVEILERDYRDVAGRFDRIVSIGMFEHVGPANYGAYFDGMRGLLAADGLFLLHTIGGPQPAHSTDPWLARYIFPGTVLPSARNLTHALDGRFVIEDWENFGADYDRTLMAWHARFEDAWPALSQRYDERFRRLWRYYLLVCAGTFRARRNQVWQVVLSPRGVSSGYRRAVT